MGGAKNSQGVKSQGMKKKGKPPVQKVSLADAVGGAADAWKNGTKNQLEIIREVSAKTGVRTEDCFRALENLGEYNGGGKPVRKERRLLEKGDAPREVQERWELVENIRAGNTDTFRWMVYNWHLEKGVAAKIYSVARGVPLETAEKAVQRIGRSMRMV